MTLMDNLIEVLVPIPLMERFSYLLPKHIHRDSLKPGSRVLVPFGRRTLVGVVWKTTSLKTSGIRYKYVKDVIDREPLLNKDLMKLAEWASRYYHHPLGEIITYFFPPSLRKGSDAKFSETKFWSLTTKGEFIQLSELSKAPNQQKAIELFREKGELAQIAVKAYGISSASLKALEKKELVQYCNREASPFVKNKEVTTERKLKKLNEEQNHAVESIIDSSGSNKVFLLNGITGSGKTEVYIRAIQDTISKGKQALVLIPEIGLAPQSEDRFKKYFGERVLSFHSAKSEKEKLNAWLGASRGLVDIIIGTRSSVFIPMSNIGLIVVDEEHDLSFKQVERFKYSARDIALYRAKLQNIPIILASATPSLETLNNALINKYQILNLTKRATGAELPKYQLVDLRGESLESGLSQELINGIEGELESGNQILIFLNRRGYAPSMICKSCGWISTCNRCDAHMTLHKKPLKLHCHHCDAQKEKPSKCPECDSSKFESYGHGTERVEEFLKERFPDFPVLRIDSDSTRKKDSMSNYLNIIKEGSPMVLLGTQLLAKGHHFPDVTLVGVVDADSGLFSADFRGSERVAQLMTQVAGRAGRDKKPGKVLLQTYCPEHPQIEELMKGNYENFARQLLVERKLLNSPPFYFQAKIQAESMNSSTSRNFIIKLLDDLTKNKNKPKGLRVVGPLPSIMEKKSGVFRWEINIFSENRKSLHEFLDSTQSLLYRKEVSKKVRWSLNIDPISLV